jgi:hypothetical protein
MVGRADSGRDQDGSGSAPICSPSAQVKAAVSHIRRLSGTSEREINFESGASLRDSEIMKPW